MADSREKTASNSAAGNGGHAAETNGNGGGRSDAIGDPEFFLVPLLASDPLPYLVDGDGNPVNAEGMPVSNGNGNGVPAAIKKLQEEASPAGGSSQED